MLLAIFGPPKCGKSEYAERILASRGGRTTYVGTLPSSSFYRDLVRAHQIRRPPQWGLVELVGNVEQDLDSLLRIQHTSENVLIDGVSFYIARCLTLSEPWFCHRQRTWEILSAAQHHSGLVVVVDSPSRMASTVLERRSIRSIQIAIARRANRIIWFDGNARSVTPIGALKLLKSSI